MRRFLGRLRNLDVARSLSVSRNKTPRCHASVQYCCTALKFVASPAIVVSLHSTAPNNLVRGCDATPSSSLVGAL